MNPWEIEIDAQWLKNSIMRMKLCIEKEKYLLSDICGKVILEVQGGEASKCCKNKNMRHNNQKQW